MRNILFLGLLITFTASVSAQTPTGTMRLTLEEAVNLALDNNIDLAADRLDPQIGDMRVAGAAGAFRPSLTSSVQRNNQLQPPASFLIPTPTRTDVVTSSVGLGQRLPWLGTSYNISWDNTHTASDSFLSSYNPLLRSGLSVNLSQPLFRDLITDSSRSQLMLAQGNRSIADTRLRESLVHTAANVKTAYWNLASAVATVDARKSSLLLAEELVRVNKAKVDVGQSPPLDLVSAQAEVVSNREQLIVAETAVRQAEDRLRSLIFDATKRDVWNVRLEAVDTPPVGTTALDIDSAVTNALRSRADLDRARQEIGNAQVSEKLAGNQRLPDVRLSATYQASGLGGTQVLRSGGFPGTVVGPGLVTNFGNILNQLFASDYPTWVVGVNVSYPIGQSAEQASYARSRLEAAQAQQRAKSAEVRVIQQVRDAGWKVEMNAKRLETARAGRELAEQRLDAEQKRFEVGISTSFLVIQAQRDLAQARTNEVSAILSYDLSLVDFESLQQAGPAGQTSAPANTSQPTAAAPAPTNPAARPGGAGAASLIPAGVF
jgi:outer membrane protein TolC